MSRSVGLLSLIPALTLLAACGDVSAPDIDSVIGTYSYSARGQAITFDFVVRFTSQSGGSFSGTYSSAGASYPVSGTIAGSTINFSLQGPGITTANNGTWSNGNVSGTYTVTQSGSTSALTGNFTLARTSTSVAVAGTDVVGSLESRRR